MAQPLVSCILATRNRQPFLQQAIKYFCRQEYPNKELIIVDDSVKAAVDIVPDDARIRSLRLDEQTPLGRKLNLGIGASSGPLLQKLDDDDYYHPDFLATTVTALQGADPKQAIVGLDCFLVLIAATGELKFSGHGWCASSRCLFLQTTLGARPLPGGTTSSRLVVVAGSCTTASYQIFSSRTPTSSSDTMLVISGQGWASRT